MLDLVASRRRLGWWIATLVLATLLALFVFRQTGDIWGMYAFLALGLVNLFLVALSRGRAIGLIAGSTSMAVLVWVAWLWLRPEGPAASGTQRWAPVTLLIFALAYAALGGWSTVLSTVRVRGTYLLVMIAGVLGLWWTIAVILDGGLGYTTLFDVAVVIGLVAPLIFVIGAIGRGPNSIASYLIAISSYVTVAHAIVNALIYVFTNVLPDVLEVPRPTPDSEPPWLTVLQWKVAVSSIGVLGAFALVAAVSVSTVARAYRAADYPFLRSQVEAAFHRMNQASDLFSIMAIRISLTTMKVARVIYLAAVFIALSAKEFARRAWQTAKRVVSAVWSAIRFFAMPVITLGAAGVILLAAVRDVSAYGQGTSTIVNGEELWGGVVLLSAAILGLCGISFLVAALAKNTQTFSFNGLGVTMLLAAGFWALVSLGSIAMWPIWRALKSVDVQADGLSLGPALWTNNIAMLALATILVLAGLVSGGIRSQRDVARPKLFMITAVVILVLVSITAFVLGWMPLAHWIGHLFA